MILRGHTLGAPHQDRSNLGHMTQDAHWHHQTTAVMTPFEDRPHFGMDDRIPEHNVFANLRLAGTGKVRYNDATLQKRPKSGRIPVTVRWPDGVEKQYRSINSAALLFTESFAGHESQKFSARGWWRFPGGIIMWPTGRPFPDMTEK